MAWRPDYVTLEAQKLYMGIEHDNDDAKLTVAITAASRAVDDHCNRQFGKADAPQTRVYTAWPDHEDGTWVVEIDDLTDATGLVVSTPQGTIDAGSYTLEPVNAVADGYAWTQIRISRTSAVQPCGAKNEISVAADTWGWSVGVPVPVVQATNLQASRFANRADSPYGVAGSPDEGNESRLLAVLDPDVRVSLRGPLRRSRAVG